MMTPITFIYLQSELAQAAYATLIRSDTATQRQSLIDQDFTITQAEEFAARYPEIITQFPEIDAEVNDTDTSFSATIFKDIAGNLTLAFRGTSDFGDISPTDEHIFRFGAGYDQIVAMVNWWLRIASPIGERNGAGAEMFQISPIIDIPEQERLTYFPGALH